MPLADRVFERFVALYGAQRFRAMFEHDDNAITPAKDSWERVLTSVKPDVLRRVMESLPSQGREWPPNLSEFIRMCQEYNRVEQRDYIALPLPRQQTEVGITALAKIREMLKMPPKVEVEKT